MSVIEQNPELYKVVYRDIAGRIRDGKLRTGDRVLPLREMCNAYGVSMITVRKAVDMLANEGLLEKRRGSGSFVRGAPVTKVSLLAEQHTFTRPLALRILDLLSGGENGLEIQPMAVTEIAAGSVGGAMLRINTPGMIICAGHFDELASNGYLVPLDTLDGFQAIRSLYPTHVDLRNYAQNGMPAHYFLPLTINPTVFAVNTDLARRSGLPHDRAPADWEELVAWCAAFARWAGRHAPDLHPTFCSARGLLGYHLSYAAMAAGPSGPGGDLHDLSSPGMADFIGLLHRLVDGRYAEITDTNSDHNPNPFLSGRYLFKLSARPWDYFDSMGFSGLNFRLFPVPLRRKGQQRRSAFGSLRLGILKTATVSARELDACWNAIRALLENEVLDRDIANNKSFPARLPEATRMVQEQPELSAFLESFDYLYPEPTSSTGLRRKWALNSLLAQYFSKEDKKDALLNALKYIVTDGECE